MKLIELVGEDCEVVSETTVGEAVSIVMSFAPPMLFVPVGSVVDVIAFPAVSRTVPMVKLETVRSAAVSPASTVYVPENVWPADTAVSVTVLPLFRVAEMVLPARTDSEAVAVTFTVSPALYAPFAVVEENEVMVGAVVSTTRLLASAMLKPLGIAVEVMALPAPSKTPTMLKLLTFSDDAEFPDAIV